MRACQEDAFEAWAAETLATRILREKLAAARKLLTCGIYRRVISWWKTYTVDAIWQRGRRVSADQ